LTDLGLVAENQGKYTQAESLYKQAISAYEKSPGLYPADIAVALGSLGRLYRDQEQFNLAQAEPLFRQALDIREKSLGQTTLTQPRL